MEVEGMEHLMDESGDLGLVVIVGHEGFVEHGEPDQRSVGIVVFLLTCSTFLRK